MKIVDSLLSTRVAICTVLLLCCSIFGCQNGPDDSKPITQSTNHQTSSFTGESYLSEVRSADNDQRYQMLAEAHNRIRTMFGDDDIRMRTVFDEIREERPQYAPDFPQRGETSEESQRNMKYWLTNHPEQLAIYLEYLDNKFDELTRSLQSQ